MYVYIHVYLFIYSDYVNVQENAITTYVLEEGRAKVLSTGTGLARRASKQDAEDRKGCPHKDCQMNLFTAIQSRTFLLRPLRKSGFVREHIAASCDLR